MYLDAQPLLVQFIKCFHLQAYGIAIVNLLPIISIALSSIPLFLLQRYFKLPLLFNIISSVLIALLSPQIARATGHFALSYSFYIPSLYCLLLCLDKGFFTKYFIVFLWVIGFSLLHPYYLLIGALIVGSFSFYHIFIRFHLKAFLFNIFTTVSVLFCFKIFMYLTDTVTDRPVNPYGMDVYKSSFKGLFLQKIQPLVELGFSNFSPASFESSAYLGILGLPMILIFLLLLFFKVVNKESLVFKNSKAFIYLFVSVSFIWLFALYTPLKFILDPLQNLIPALKQFRGLGRLGWIVYFIYSLVISQVIYIIYLAFSERTKFAFVLPLLFYFLWFLDANANMNSYKRKLDKSVSYTELKKKCTNIIEKNNLETIKIDALLALPKYHLGSEIKNIEAHSVSYSYVYEFANQLNKPIVSTHSSRTSKKQFDAFYKLHIDNSFEDLASNNTQILFIADKNMISKNDSILLSQSDTLYSKDWLLIAKYSVSY